ncbi:MAG: hypothetical protein A3F78_16465 [Burkholderiales bacterium RIFCSPLOWO2_12_FULL_61_40]|nr:MAG: hypothetical protein A3F78_16465 [Burkholderiales bacterium RIFCSPLOWO2_12_FULL_61_40]
MNRCLPKLSPRPAAWRFGLLAALLCLGASAMAQTAAVRPFPPTAQRGTMQITNPPNMLMNGELARLSPGARIRGTNNMLVMSGALVGQTLLVAYVREPLGLVHEVWVLTEAEAQAAKP